MANGREHRCGTDARGHLARTRTRTITNPNDTEANASGRSGNARALRKQSKCGVIQEGEGHWPNSSENLQKARYLWVLRTPQNNEEEGARARATKLVTCEGPPTSERVVCVYPEDRGAQFPRYYILYMRYRIWICVCVVRACAVPMTLSFGYEYERYAKFFFFARRS